MIKKLLLLVVCVAVMAALVPSYMGAMIISDGGPAVKKVTQDSGATPPGRFITSAKALSGLSNELYFTAEVRKCFVYTLFAHASIEADIAVYPNTWPTVSRYTDSWGNPFNGYGPVHTTSYSSSSPIAAQFTAHHDGLTIAMQPHFKTYVGYVAAGNGQVTATYSSQTIINFLDNLFWTVVPWLV